MGPKVVKNVVAVVVFFCKIVPRPLGVVKQVV